MVRLTFLIFYLYLIWDNAHKKTIIKKKNISLKKKRCLVQVKAKNANFHPLSLDRLMLYLQKIIKYIQKNTWMHYFTHIIKTLSTSGNSHSLTVYIIHITVI